MAEAEDGHKSRHAVVLSHRCLHSWFTPTHLTLGSTHQSKLEERNAVWRSRRSRKARYSTVPHIIANEQITERKPTSEKVSEDATALERRIVNLRVQTQTNGIKPHLVLDVTFWLAVTFTFGSAIWVINGKST